MSKHKIICGKSEIELKQFEDNTFDSCVTDPPYGLEFMGKDWDKFNISESRAAYLSSTRKQDCKYKLEGEGRYSDMSLKEKNTFQQFTYEWASELYRVMKPGAHILIFGGTRTYHRMACAVEDAGFEVRDMIEWVYGSGFPKSLDVSKAFDMMNGKEREVIGQNLHGVGSWMLPQKQKHRAEGGTGIGYADGSGKKFSITAPATEEAIQWNGWGSNLKPSHEPILLARKPISERNIASNVLKWGVGGLNIDGCRIPFEKGGSIATNPLLRKICGAKIVCGGDKSPTSFKVRDEPEEMHINEQGRFPANWILECCCEEGELIEGEIGEVKVSKAKRTHGDWLEKTGFGDTTKRTTFTDKAAIHTNPNCVCRMLDKQSGETKSTDSIRHNNQSDISGKKGIYGKFNNKDTQGFSDKGGSSRFFYQAKASQAERWFYCTICKKAYPMKERDKHIHNAPEETKYKYLEFHPTQKPESLISYLMRLITPPCGTTIDPFLGSGTAIIAAEREGFNCVGIDSKSEYCEMSYRRGKGELIQQKISGDPSTIEKTGF